METAAVYARKSKASDKGESTENQISRGAALCKLRGWNHVVYEDYDYSGKTLERPAFERMMQDAKDGKIKYIICYKLDRISRSVSDFSGLITELNELDVGFVSIKENFDTSTPMGRAMMMITAVFAQLERETIVERVKDNMVDRFKSGKWNGGVVPFGYEADRKSIIVNGKTKNVTDLIPNEKECAIIKQLFDWYVKDDLSMRKIAHTANSSEYGFTTRAGVGWSPTKASRIIKNALYCIADKDAYDYFKNHTKMQIVSDEKDFTGEYGLMFYNRRKPHKKSTRVRSEDEWYVGIGSHKGVVPGEIYAKAQLKLKRNISTAPRSSQSTRSPLSGLVRCDKCGHAMALVASPKANDISKGYFLYFKCRVRNDRSEELCDNEVSMRADYLEELIVNHIKQLYNDEHYINELLDNSAQEVDDKRIPLMARQNKIDSEIKTTEREMDNLVTALTKGTLPEFLIKKKYKELEDKKNSLLHELNKIQYELQTNSIESINIETARYHLKQFTTLYEFLDIEEKKKLLKSIVREINIYNGVVELTLYFSATSYTSSSDLVSHAHGLRANIKFTEAG
ncbi:recombinase family protein [Anaeromicrobium sediminis]|uniref:Recombinase family protein n=1 Tax=Anaeromicrobium sediminis TaxID=1478221 RepID=A0A267MP95_9FIRM|nr:recombinase family protein [Anaeromicrobium sediminis]PAB61356.1 hypothetical protein CCE28_02700 [Anaeromicrobium sediminis]